MQTRIPDFSQGAEGACPAIFSVSGKELSKEEADFFCDVNPLGFILFGRNCETPEQLQKLTDALKETVGRECPILIDQEGGRVQRLKKPFCERYPNAETLAESVDLTSDDPFSQIIKRTQNLARDLKRFGLNTNCDPVLDIRTEDTHEVIGDRSFGTDPVFVGRVGQVICETYLSHGVQPIIKHMPGHGRGNADSHDELPVVSVSEAELEQNDFAPFRHVSGSSVGHAVWGMTGHLKYTAIDSDLPVSLSKTCIDRAIRGSIGFDGILLCDDLDMKALADYGSIADRAEQGIQAGCDIALYCWAKMLDMRAIADRLAPISEKSFARLERAASVSSLAA